ncbi:hypothetical protein [Streptomyces sp. DW26H14]|uniref:hypothetical protein n=1 Tax=Streptomyces sp. DW26H14 TaxID=3435395 RepID=UPI00403DA0E2
MTATTHRCSPPAAAAALLAGVGGPPGAPPACPAGPVVGPALGRDPLLLVRPCRRVIGADGAPRERADGAGHHARPRGLERVLPV